MSTGSEQFTSADPTPNPDDRSPSRTRAERIADILAVADSLPINDRLRVIADMWGSLPPGQFPAPSSQDLAELRRHLDNYDARQVDVFPWPAISRLMAGRDAEPVARVYSAPRRFDLATIFVVTLAYSLLLGAMSAAGFVPVASLIVVGFITLVGAGQALLLGGQRPRTASILVGIVLYLLAMLVFWILNGQRIYASSFMLVMASYSIVGGAILGYVAGGTVGGVFLVADKVRSRFSRSAAAVQEATLADSQSASPWND